MELLTQLTLGICGLIAAVLVGLLREEASAWLPTLTDQLLRLAVWRAPRAQREQYATEWRADVDEFPGKLSRFVRACGCVRAAGGLRPWTKARVGFYAQSLEFAVHFFAFFGFLIFIQIRMPGEYLYFVLYGFNMIVAYADAIGSFAGILHYVRTSR